MPRHVGDIVASRVLQERVEVDDARGVHDEGRPAEKLVRANARRSCTSRSTLQARWNKRVILLYSLYSRMV